MFSLFRRPISQPTTPAEIWPELIPVAPADFDAIVASSLADIQGVPLYQRGADTTKVWPLRSPPKPCQKWDDRARDLLSIHIHNASDNRTLSR